MTNLQLLLSIGVPTFFVLAGILLNHREVTNLKNDMNRQFDKVDSRLTRIEEDQKQFFRTTGIIDGRLDELS